MNEKAAKELRRHARRITVGEPNIDYAWIKPACTCAARERHSPKKIMVLTKRCTRGVYRRLKRIVKQRAKSA